MSEDVAGRALRGIPWVLASVVTGRLLALVTMIVLARLLDPATIGVVLTALVIVRTLNVISDNGLAISLVVRPELPERLVGTVLSITMALAVALAALLAALAGPVAALFGQPRLSDILPALAVTIVFSTMTWLLSNLLQREMLFRSRFVGQFALVATNAAVAIPLAALGLGVWSMVAGQIASTAVSAVVLWRAYPGRLVPALDAAMARTAFRESRGYIAQGVTVFLSDNAHFLSVSSVLGARPMALYSTSYRIGLLPSTALSGPVAEATFPAYAELRDDEPRRAEAVLAALRFVVTPSAAPLAILAVLAGPFVAAVLGASWTGMAPVLAILCLWGMLVPTGETIAWFLNAAGEPRYLARVNIGRLVVFAPALFLTALLTGSLTATASMLVIEAIYEVAFLLTRVHRRHGLAFGAVSRTTWPAIAVAVAAAAAAAVARGVVAGAGTGPWAQLLLGALAGGIAAFAALWATDRAFLQDAAGLGRRALRRPGAP